MLTYPTDVIKQKTYLLYKAGMFLINIDSLLIYSFFFTSF